jgi:hypothetical protein
MQASTLISFLVTAAGNLKFQDKVLQAISF